MRYLATYCDEGGLPRAWGAAAVLTDAKHEARRQLSKYIAKKRALGEPITDSDFRLQTQTISEVTA